MKKKGGKKSERGNRSAWPISGCHNDLRGESFAGRNSSPRLRGNPKINDARDGGGKGPSLRGKGYATTARRVTRTWENRNAHLIQHENKSRR